MTGAPKAPARATPPSRQLSAAEPEDQVTALQADSLQLRYHAPLPADDEATAQAAYLLRTHVTPGHEPRLLTPGQQPLRPHVPDPYVGIDLVDGILAAGVCPVECPNEDGYPCFRGAGEKLV